jgi:hypothetical protein
MPTHAPVSHHLDLYRYWLAKRGSSPMPARSDINPADFPALLPYLGLVNKVDGQFRWRLVGTAAVREIGRDPTGSIVGSFNSTPESAAALQSIFERTFACAHPVFATGEFKTGTGTNHNISLLVLPLSDDGTTVNMAVLTRVARFNFDVTATANWLKGARVKVRDVIDVHDAAELEERSLDWERYCSNRGDRA